MASDPQFSPNGRWLAYTVAGSRLWVARADGTAPKPVGSTAPKPASYGGRGDWLPDGRLVAAEHLWRVSAAGTLVRAGAIPAELAAWAPDGTAYAFTSERRTSSHGRAWTSIERLSISRSLGGPRRTLMTIPVSFTPRSGLSGGLFDGVYVLPHNEGVLFKLDPGGSDAADGLDLLDAAPGHRPHDLGATLGIPLTLGSPGRFAIGSGGNRYAWQTKQVEVCDAATVRCSAVATARGYLSFDPAFSAATGALAFVQAPSSNAANIGQASVHRWYATHLLWVLRRGRSRPVAIAATAGAAAPVWSADGRSLLYVADDSLWLLPALSSKPVRVTAPLFEANVWPGYYGEVGWSSQFAWSSRA